jgi:hypothetical protein
MTKKGMVLVCGVDGSQELVEREIPVTEEETVEVPTMEERLAALEAAMLVMMGGMSDV